MGRKPKRQVQDQSYLFAISQWDVNYNFSNEIGLGPYKEEVYLNIEALGIFPERLSDQNFQFSLYGSRDLDLALSEPRTNPREPIGVGDLTFRGDRRGYFGSLPHSALMALLPSIESGQIRSIHLYGHALRHGRATISSIDFAKEYDRDEC